VIGRVGGQGREQQYSEGCGFHEAHATSAKQEKLAALGQAGKLSDAPIRRRTD
jgi:hypothetical protein